MLRRTLTSQLAIHRRSGAACISTSRLPIPRKFLSTDQLSSDQFQHLLDTAIDFKKRNIENTVLQGETLLMIFQKRSTRTRLSSEIGMQRLGGRALFLSSDDIQLGVNESLKDSARVMSRFGSILLARVHGHGDVKKLADESSIPVINALSDKFHPLQALADYMTIQEHFGSGKGLTVSWVGDGNNVLHDYMLAAPLVGANIQIATPRGYDPDADVVAKTLELAKAAGTTVTLTNDPLKAVKGAHVVATDTWVSMGQEDQAMKRVAAFAGYQVTKTMLKHAASNHIFLHCLPRHAEEVDDEVFYSDRSLVFDEAENRMWTVMAVLANIVK
ncbi:ornithine carbamoyltransferase [Aphanomyces astaci]|uniref:ornithine carbamoyltransferase n=3 Tax=Aphanomyces astaci TaxID=112090 RepID=W4HAE9_APHAT|nr:ornithine carbamoyltransferase [Aphanomyces astaci]ETV88254.1 ornithine carbamoyltransferase [Aphanomyces astaci]|eukprot:XP_009823117.1 ornithine carbamoyltransferase [Aphanomyces astaci]